MGAGDSRYNQPVESRLSIAPHHSAGPLPWKQRVKRVSVQFLVGYLLWLCVAGVLQRHILFPRYLAQAMTSPGEGVARLERIWLDTDQGKVEGWFVPGEGVSAASPGPVVFYAHGNAELIDYFPYILDPYLRRGVSVMLVEFRGYGRSAGSPSQARITDDYIRFYDMIAARPEVDRDRIIFHGRSIGTGVVCSLAQHRKPAAMILQSPFSSVRRIMGGYLVPPFLCWDPFDNAKVVRELDRPILIMHGTRDEVIPFAHGRSLHDVAKKAQFCEYDCGHNDFPIESERYWREISDFLRAHGVVAGNEPLVELTADQRP